MFNNNILKEKLKVNLNKKIKFNVLDLNIFLFENLNYKKIKKISKKINFFKTEFLLSKADLENQKKLHLQEINKVSKFAIENFAENLLDVLDSLESALIIKNFDIEKLLEGIRLTLKLLINNFEKNNIKQILPIINEKFDPNKHLAISTVKINENDDTIIKVLQKGFYIFNRILRPALVVVNKV